jgi:thymidylate synthase
MENSLDSMLQEIEVNVRKKGDIVITRGKKTKELSNVYLRIDSEQCQGVYDEKEFKIEFRTSLKQIKNISALLKKDNYTRQAVIDNWNTDKPCNVLLQFLYRQKALDLIVYSRSIDITRLKNDMLSLASFLRVLSLETGLETGRLHMHIASLHKYVK